MRKDLHKSDLTCPIYAPQECIPGGERSRRAGYNGPSTSAARVAQKARRCRVLTDGAEAVRQLRQRSTETTRGRRMCRRRSRSRGRPFCDNRRRTPSTRGMLEAPARADAGTQQLPLPRRAMRCPHNIIDPTNHWLHARIRKDRPTPARAAPWLSTNGGAHTPASHVATCMGGLHDAHTAGVDVRGGAHRGRAWRP